MGHPGEFDVIAGYKIGKRENRVEEPIMKKAKGKISGKRKEGWKWEKEKEETGMSVYPLEKRGERNGWRERLVENVQKHRDLGVVREEEHSHRVLIDRLSRDYNKKDEKAAYRLSAAAARESGFDGV